LERDGDAACLSSYNSYDSCAVPVTFTESLTQETLWYLASTSTVHFGLYTVDRVLLEQPQPVATVAPTPTVSGTLDEVYYAMLTVPVPDHCRTSSIPDSMTWTATT